MKGLAEVIAVQAEAAIRRRIDAERTELADEMVNLLSQILIRGYLDGKFENHCFKTGNTLCYRYAIIKPHTKKKEERPGDGKAPGLSETK